MLFENPLKKNWQGKTCVILPHISPDGDAIGSCLALYYFLKKQTDRVWIVSDDPLPFILRFLCAPLTSLESFQAMGILPDGVFCLDSSDTERLGKRSVLLETGKIVINIDHHKTNLMYGDINVVDAEVSSTGELLYTLIQDSGNDVDKLMAQAIYVAMSSDTGSFKYSNTKGKTMNVAANLIEKGIDLEAINIALYQDDPKEKFFTLQAAMENALWEENGRVVVTWVALADVERFCIKSMETEGIAEFFRDIHGVDVVMLLKEQSDHRFKVSFRSKREFDVSALALSLGGGGHARAAGCTVDGPLEKAVQTVKKAYEEKVKN